MRQARSILILAGPTASGKSAFALDTARALNGTIINADSMQVYRELRLLSARPSPADEALIPHKLYGVMSAADPCSVGRWLDLAVREIDAAFAEGRLPVLVGGTGLYLKALLKGLSFIPDIPAEIRAEVRMLYDRLGGEAFRGALAKIDPRGAERILPGDRQRLIRAFEVARATGRTLAAWQAETAGSPLNGIDRRAVVLVAPPRAALYAAIEARFEGMLEAGALAEVRALAALGLSADLPALKAVGIPELMAHVEGKIPLDQAVMKAKQASRNYAKRQLTWFRNQFEQNHTINEQYSESLFEKNFPFIRDLLLTPLP
ncbi:MAG: tRNA (adenosine(37)-N6)-dimethylallyltransferase MiaA [Rhodospirillales bacterium]